MTSFQPPSPFVEPTGRRIRVRLGDEIVAQSDRAQLLVQYGPGGLPTYYLPRMDVVDGALVDEKSDDGQRTWTVRVGGKRAERAAWTHPDPSGALATLADHVTFSWRQLEWYEEDERVVMHARDPHHRVDTLRSSRRVQVLAGGQVVADSVRPLLLFETALPTRYYLPFEDVRTELFEASDATSVCPYKGRARYWSIRVGDSLVKDVAWSYPDPMPENPKIRDLVAFFQARSARSFVTAAPGVRHIRRRRLAQGTRNQHQPSYTRGGTGLGRQSRGLRVAGPAGIPILMANSVLGSEAENTVGENALLPQFGRL